MRDLYRNLDIDGSVADPNVLRQAIDQCADADTARAARYILLNPKRKQFYDRHHRVLSTIGELRAKLTMPRSYEWDALGNQEFDCDISGSSTEWLDDLEELDPLDEFPLDAPVHHLPTRSYSHPFGPAQIALGGIVGVCVCLLLAIFAMLRPTPETLPENGRVVRYVENPADSKIQFKTRSGAGHNFVELVSALDERLVLTVFVRDGQNTTVDVTSGSYELRFSVGEEREWNGRTFRRQLREIKPPKISVRPGQICIIQIP